MPWCPSAAQIAWRQKPEALCDAGAASTPTTAALAAMIAPTANARV
jgi:hypothetical protein